MTNTLIAIRRHLTPGGTVVIDGIEPTLLIQEYYAQATNKGFTPLRPTGNVFRLPDEERYVSEWTSIHVDTINQRVDRWLIYEISDEKGEVIKRIKRRVEITYVLPRECIHLLIRAGFTPVALYGSFSRDTTIQLGGDIIWVAQTNP